MSWIAVGVVGATALYKVGSGIVKNNKARAIEKANPYPSYEIPQEYQDNVRQAQQMAQQGIPAQAYNNQVSSINRNQAGATEALGRSANPGAGLASVVRAGNDATGDLNAQDAIQRNRNLLTLLQERQVLAQQKEKEWSWDHQQKYLGNLAKSQALRGAANSDINSGFSEIGSLGTTVAGGGVTGGSTGGSGGFMSKGYADSTPVGADQSTIG